MKLRFLIFAFLFGLMVLPAGVSFANTLTDPMIIFGNSPTGTPVSTCFAPNTCGTGLDSTGSTPAEGMTGNLTYFNDTTTTFENFIVSVDTPFTGALSCGFAPSDSVLPFNMATPSGNSCIFSETTLTTLDPGGTFDLQYLGFTGLSSLTYGFSSTSFITAPEPSPFVLLGTGLAALFALSVGRKRFNWV